jgi:hypothetical protein
MGPILLPSVLLTAPRDFGKIVDGEMVLTPLGQVAAKCWAEMPAHFPFVVVDAYVVMPNHVHGIIIIDKPNDLSVETQYLPGTARQGDIASLQCMRVNPQHRSNYRITIPIANKIVTTAAAQSMGRACNGMRLERGSTVP